MTQDIWTPDRSGWRTVPCALCGSQQFTVLATADRYDLGLVTAGCTTCGLVMTNPVPDAASLEEFYRDHYRHYYQKVDAPDAAYISQYRKDERAAATAAFFRDAGLIFPGAAVLDIGASEGCILKAVADLVPDSRRTAVEPNAVFGDFAVQHAGCALYASVEDLQAAGSARFDLIVLNHVYEHVADPVRFLSGLSTLLTQNGRVYIDVPDIEEYEDLSSLHIAHLFHFGEHTLRSAAGLAGFQVESMEKHRPIMHPPSLRCVLRPGKATVTTPENRQAGWDRVRRADRHAQRYLRKRRMQKTAGFVAAPTTFDMVPIDGFKSLARPTPRLDRLAADDLEQLNAIVKWNCFTVDSEGRRVGDRARPGKRDLPQQIPSRTIVVLDELIGLSDKHVLEIGCFEGVHTIGLCDRAREVTAIDSRMENVVKAILRCYLYGCSPDIRRCDAESEDDLNDLPEVDVVHHVGVLYHLVDPVAHLERLSRKIRSAILLDTHVAAPEQAIQVLESGGQQYPCSRHREGGVKEVFSGMSDHANWLTLETLTSLLERLGFNQIDVLESRGERNGLRAAILAKR